MNNDIKEHFTVLGVGLGGITFSFVDMEHLLRIIVLIGSAIYVWRKALKRRKNKNDSDTDL